MISLTPSIQKEKEGKKDKTQCILTVPLTIVAEWQRARAEPLCWLANPLGKTQIWHSVKDAKSGCEQYLTLAMHSDKKLKKWILYAVSRFLTTK